MDNLAKMEMELKQNIDSLHDSRKSMQEMRKQLDNYKKFEKTSKQQSKHIFELENKIKALEQENIKLNRKIQKNDLKLKEIEDNHRKTLKEERDKIQEEMKMRDDTINTLSERIDKMRNFEKYTHRQERLVKDAIAEYETKKEALSQNSSSILARFQSKHDSFKANLRQNIKDRENEIDNKFAKFMANASDMLVVQNHQLIADTEFQASHIKSIEIENNFLKQRNMELQALAELNEDMRTIVLKKKVKRPKKLLNKTEVITEVPTMKSTEVVGQAVENKLLAAKMECNRLKSKHREIENTVTEYRTKFRFLFELLDEHLEVLVKREHRLKTKHIEMHIDGRKLNFKEDSYEKQYAFTVFLLNCIGEMVDKKTFERAIFGKEKFENVSLMVNRRMKLKKVNSSNIGDVFYTNRHSRAASQSSLPYF